MSRRGANPSAPRTGPGPGSSPEPYRGVVFVLGALALLGAAGALAGGATFPDPLLLDTAVTLGIASGILAGVALAQVARARPPTRPPKSREADSESLPAEPAQAQVTAEQNTSPITQLPRKAHGSEEDWAGMARTGTAAAGAAAIVMVLPFNFAATLAPTPLVAGIVAAFCLAGAGLAATAARYLAGVDPSRLPESPGLCRGARVAAWILVLAAVSCGLVWAGLQAILRILEFAVPAVNAAVCYGLFGPRQVRGDVAPTFPLDIAVLSVLGTRSNLIASILDSAEAQFGIDLRSTWALTVVRRSLEPLVIGLCLLAWLSTSLTVVGVDEQGLVERLGVPVGGDPLTPGLHLHWPWPMDRVFRIPVKQVQALAVGTCETRFLGTLPT